MNRKLCEILLFHVMLNIASADQSLSLGKPSFESEWQAIAAQDPNMKTLSIPHNLGEYPVKVDVQIKVTTNDKEYIFTGIGSAHRDDSIDKYYGGTVYIYNEHEIIVTFPIQDNDVGKGGIAYTGLHELYKGPKEIEGPYYKGAVKVRAWLAVNLPSPAIKISVDIDNKNNYKEVVHKLGLYPDMVFVQIFLETGYISDAQGTVLEDTSDSSCDTGGVVFGYDKEKIYIWASEKGVFVATDGWGLKQRYKSGKVSILGWTTDDCSKVFSKSFTVVKDGEITYSLPLQGEYDFNNHFVSVQVKIPNKHYSNDPIVFNAIGSSMPSGLHKFGGIVYVYTKERILFWTPNAANGYLVYIGGIWGSGQNYQISDTADVVITVYYVGDGPNMVIITPSKQSYRVKERTNLNQIRCTADCIPVCSMTWTGPNLPAGNTSVLNLQNISRNQAGNYQCIASNGVSNKTSVLVNVVVQYGPNMVIITPSKQSCTLKEKTNLNQIRCTADCIPVCSMTWTGPHLPAGNTSVLNLQNKSRNQAGNYQCIASNGVSNKTSVLVNVVVQYGPNMVIITPSTQSYTLKETANLIQIRCTADCIPVCTMTWSGPNLPAGNKSVLHLQNISRNQAGSYQCTASNDVCSKTSLLVNVVVQYGPIQIEISPPNNTYTVTETGSANQITCTADCNPSCATTWTGPNFPAGSTSILNLQNIDRSQAGVYSCTAINDISSLTLIKVNVIVNYGPRQVAIYPTTSNYTRNETLDGVGPINCTANCQPPFTSTWNGSNLPPDTTSVLNLANINRNQAGNYQCTASNDVSSLISGTIYVVVNYQPTISSISNHKVVNENGTETITCTVDSIPQSNISWIFENKELQNKYVGSLTLNKIDCLSMGRYICQAVNMLGVDNRYVDVTVKCSPRINSLEFTIPSTITIKDGAMLNLTGHIIAFPDPKIYWQFGQNGLYINVSSGITNSFNINRHSSNLFKRNVVETDFGIYCLYGYNGVGNTHYLLHSFVVLPERQYLTSSTSSDQNGLLTAGIACLIIGLLSITFAVSFVVYRRFRLQKRKSLRNNDYTEFNTCNPRSVVADQYDILNTTNFGTNDENENQADRNIHTYEECQLSNDTDRTYQRQTIQSKDATKKKEYIYENMII